MIRRDTNELMLLISKNHHITECLKTQGQTAEHDDLAKCLSSISSTFLKVDAPLQMNLSSNASKALQRCINDIESVWTQTQRSYCLARMEPQFMQLHRQLDICKREIFALMERCVITGDMINVPTYIVCSSWIRVWFGFVLFCLCLFSMVSSFIILCAYLVLACSDSFPRFKAKLSQTSHKMITLDLSV